MLCPIADRTESGFLVLADISGFTAFVTATELEHGAQVTGVLLGDVMEALSPPSRSRSWRATRSSPSVRTPPPPGSGVSWRCSIAPLPRSGSGGARSRRIRAARAGPAGGAGAEPEADRPSREFHAAGRARPVARGRPGHHSHAPLPEERRRAENVRALHRGGGAGVSASIRSRVECAVTRVGTRTSTKWIAT